MSCDETGCSWLLCTDAPSRRAGVVTIIWGGREVDHLEVAMSSAVLESAGLKWREGGHSKARKGRGG